MVVAAGRRLQREREVARADEDEVDMLRGDDRLGVVDARLRFDHHADGDRRARGLHVGVEIPQWAHAAAGAMALWRVMACRSR